MIGALTVQSRTDDSTDGNMTVDLVIDVGSLGFVSSGVKGRRV